MGNNFPSKSTLSDSERAVQTVDVKLTDLPPNTRENFYLRKRLVSKRRRNTRNALIYRAYLQADDKIQAVSDLSERWSLSRNKIGKVIASQRDFGTTVAAFKSEVEAIRQVRASQVINDADEYWEYLQGYIYHLFDIKASGEKYVYVEVVEEDVEITIKDDGEKAKLPGTKIKTKKVPIDEAITKAYQLKAQAAKMDADTLSQYIGKPNNTINIGDNSLVILEADQEFKKEFDKVMGKKDDKKIPTDATVVDGSVSNAG